ncbi:unnamed protein product, partial [Choristocarpus tenellus]
IREEEVEPQRRRADAAEASHNALRASSMEWLTANHIAKLEAVESTRNELRAEHDVIRADLESQLGEQADEILSLEEKGTRSLLALREGLMTFHKEKLVEQGKSHQREMLDLEERATAVEEDLAQAIASEGRLREAFSAYLISAHEQKL